MHAGCRDCYGAESLMGGTDGVALPGTETGWASDMMMVTQRLESCYFSTLPAGRSWVCALCAGCQVFLPGGDGCVRGALGRYRR